jgi:serine protease Do
VHRSVQFADAELKQICNIARFWAGGEFMSVMNRNRKWLAGVVCTMLVAGAAIGWAEVKSNGRPHVEARDVRALSSVFRDVAKSARSAVVTIETTSKPLQVSGNMPDLDQGPLGDMLRNQPEFRQFFQRQPQSHPMHGMGSGFVIDPSGIILTNRHVVNGAQEVTVKFADGREFRVGANDIKTDPRTDIAIVRVKDAGRLDAIPMGNSDQTEVGDWVLAIGSPFGLNMTVTAGIISAKGRGINKTEREDYLQTDAAINPGNSGGPLLNLDGEVIGINTAISTRSGGYDGVGFAIPINMARWVADQLITKGEVKRAYIGVLIRPAEGTLAKVLNIQAGEGAVVDRVMPKSPAAKAGLEAQDVILDFNGQKVAGTKELQGIVERMDVGKTYNMTIIRDGKQMTLPVTVEAMHDRPTSLAQDDEDNAPTKEKAKDTVAVEDIGVEVTALTADAAKELKLEDAKGVVLSSVKPGSLADQAGLREGMVIERVNKHPVTSPDAFRDEMKKASLSKGVIFVVHTAEGTHLVPIRKG